MAWTDPSPRTRPRATAAQPGYGAPQVRLSFLTIATRTLVALCLAGCVYAIARAGALAWLSGHPGLPRAAVGVGLPLLAALAGGWLILRALLARPQAVGLSERVRNGGGSWDDDATSAFGTQVAVVELAVDVASAVIDAATD